MNEQGENEVKKTENTGNYCGPPKEVEEQDGEALELLGSSFNLTSSGKGLGVGSEMLGLGGNNFGGISDSGDDSVSGWDSGNWATIGGENWGSITSMGISSESWGGGISESWNGSSDDGGSSISGGNSDWSNSDNGTSGLSLGSEVKVLSSDDFGGISDVGDDGTVGLWDTSAESVSENGTVWSSGNNSGSGSGLEGEMLGLGSGNFGGISDSGDGAEWSWDSSESGGWQASGGGHGEEGSENDSGMHLVG
jgi:hypothetical protein